MYKEISTSLLTKHIIIIEQNRSLSRAMASNDFPFKLLEGRPKKHNCSDCKKPLEKPMKLQCCEQLLCKECFKKLSRTQKSCPKCKQKKGFKLIKDRQKREENTIWAQHNIEGCDHLVPLDERNDHLEKCPFAEVVCTNDCGVGMLRKELANHIVNDCPKRIVSCEHCNEKSTYEQLSAHLSWCHLYPLPCPNNCTEEIKRKDFQKHQNECPLKRVACSFIEAGCRQVMPRKELQNHITNECPKRRVNCPSCTIEGQYEYIHSENHTNRCESRPLHCPNNCGHNNIEPYELQDHLEVCPLEPVKCPFFDAGCKQEIPRNELPGHNAANRDHHLELTMTVSMNTQRQLEEVELTATATKAELETVKLRARDDLKEVTRRATATKNELEDELEATKCLLKQGSIKFNGLASCVRTKTKKTTDIALKAMTTILKDNKRYCLPLVKYDHIPISHSIYIDHGYRMYVNCRKQIFLEKGENDETLLWPMPKMRIKLTTSNNTLLRNVIICPNCESGSKVDKVEGNETRREIGQVKCATFEDELRNEIFIKVKEHPCAHAPTVVSNTGRDYV